MDTQAIICALAVWSVLCAGFGYWIRGTENQSIAAGDDPTEDGRVPL